MLAVALSAANLAKVQDMKLDMVVNCAACYNRMKVANHEISTHAAVRRNVRDALERDYDGSVKVRHLLEVLLEDIGLPTITKSLKRTLNGLKVACYYGCLLVRPPEIIKFDDAENPKSLDRLVTAMGGASLEWPCKVDCCGGSLSLSRTDVVVKLTESILDMAVQVGRRLHRGQLPHVPDQPRCAAAGHQQALRQELPHAGDLHHPAPRALPGP